MCFLQGEQKQTTNGNPNERRETAQKTGHCQCLNVFIYGGENKVL